MITTPIPKGIRGDAAYTATMDAQLTAIAGAMAEIAMVQQCNLINGYGSPFDNLTTDTAKAIIMPDDTHPSVQGAKMYAERIFRLLGTAMQPEVAALKSAFTVTESTNLCNPDNLETGLLNSSGIVDSSYTTRLTTEFIETNGLYVSAYCHQTEYNDIGPVRIAFYNSDKSLKNIIIISPSITLPVDGAAYVRVSFATNWAYYFVGFSSENAKIPFAEYFESYLTIDEKTLPARITATDNWLYKFAECDFVGGNVHLSIDDVGAALYYLVNNNPASLWDSDFFSQLKTLHDTYDVCITCNCFSYLSTLQDYDIAAVPNTWASDFVGAKSWLKFAFHAKNNTINYSSAETLKTDYEYFVSAIYHMTGDYDCIDTGTRISMFTGSKTQIEQAMNIAHGITMLWTADDDRDSYYFDAAQTARTNSRGKYIDDIVGMLFVKSMPRLDNHTIDDIAVLISGKPQYGKMVELYCHENLSGTIASGTITRINGALTWFKENGYNSHFLSDIFK